jgi:dephospho-CoA kinase
MFVVGITGGIGSGKSAVTERFAERGIKVVDADVASRVVVQRGCPALSAIRDHFGPDILQGDGTLDRAALRARIFADADERRWLEELLHPRIAEYIQDELQTAQSPYAILVSPLLMETGQARFTNRILVVDAPEELQLRRAIARDNNSEQQVRAIMAAQTSRNRRLEFADDVIVNDGSLDALDDKVERLHQSYLELARQGGVTSAG